MVSASILVGFVLALGSLCSIVNSARILALFPFPGKSHSIMLNRVLDELLDRGHELDVIGNFPLKRTSSNYTHIQIDPPYDFWSDVKRKINLPGIFEMHDMTYEDTVTMLYTIGESTSEYALRHPLVQRVIHDPAPRRYDLIVVEQFYQESFLMLAHQMRAPVVSISTFGYASYFNEMFGSFGPWSHVPHELIVLPDRMSFWQRVRNVHRYAVDRYNRKYRYLASQQRLADKYFVHLPEPRPSLAELMQRVSVMLINSHAPMSPVRPVVPGLVDVGGLHITDPRPLPNDLQQFLDGATDGVIFFSLGTQVQSAEMPKAQLNAFLRVFSRLTKQRILWKWEADTLDANMHPDNLMVKKWMPQNDILAHPNVRVFITHGGLLGSQEGVWYGVPMLGIPFYADQHQNTQNTQMAGLAIALQFDNVTETSLMWALNELLHNPSYAAKAKLASRIFRDRPERAIDRATYWIEYVIRFGGTNHLRSSALELTWTSYLLLDILIAGLAVLLAILLVVKCTVGKLFGGSTKRRVEKKIQ